MNQIDIAEKLYRNFQYQKAKDVLLNEREKERENIRILNLLSKVEINLNNFELAKTYLDEALQIDNKNGITHAILACYFRKTNKLLENAREVEIAYSLDRGSPEVIYEYALSKNITNQGIEGIKVLKEYLSRHPDDFSMTYLLVIFSLKQKQNDDVFHYLKVLLRLKRDLKTILLYIVFSTIALMNIWWVRVLTVSLYFFVIFELIFKGEIVYILVIVITLIFLIIKKAYLHL